jgi:integrase
VIRFYDLRHSAASLLGAVGVPLLVVSQILGYSSVKITADTYSQVFAPALRDAAVAREAALG